VGLEGPGGLAQARREAPSRAVCQRGRIPGLGSNGHLGSQPAAPCLPGLYSVPSPHGKDRVHITQKPLLLLRQLIGITASGATVLDPFAGSGTTGVAAVLEGRRFIGIEKSEAIALGARDRIIEAERTVSSRQGAAT
jgi:site-specific DNA-methyltransferase (adenine-specific)